MLRPPFHASQGRKLIQYDPSQRLFLFPRAVPFIGSGRGLAERMRASLGQPIIIENVGGAEGSIGTGRAARAQPDGYTLDLGASNTHALNGAFYSLQYDVLNDFASVTPLVTFPFLLFARKAMPPKNLNELIAWLKANPHKASVAVTNTSVRLLAAFFQKETATQFTVVPYGSLPAAVQDLAAGQDPPFIGYTGSAAADAGRGALKPTL